MQNQILSLDTISKRPSATFGKTTISLSQGEKYDSAMFLNKIAEICPNSQEIQKLVYCAGPGAFSPTRAVAIIARLLKRLNPELKVYKLNLLYAYYLVLKEMKPPPSGIPLTGALNFLTEEAEIINPNISSSHCQGDGGGFFTIYLKAGLKGFFREVYNKNSTIEQAHLVPEITEKGFLIEEENYSFSLSEKLQSLLIEGKLEHCLVRDGLDDLKPLYLREVSLTTPKKKAI